jgi:hypothetical protein
MLLLLQSPLRLLLSHRLQQLEEAKRMMQVAVPSPG